MAFTVTPVNPKVAFIFGSVDSAILYTFVLGAGLRVARKSRNLRPSVSCSSADGSMKYAILETFEKGFQLKMRTGTAVPEAFQNEMSAKHQRLRFLSDDA